MRQFQVSPPPENGKGSASARRSPKVSALARGICSERISRISEPRVSKPHKSSLCRFIRDLSTLPASRSPPLPSPPLPPPNLLLQTCRPVKDRRVRLGRFFAFLIKFDIGDIESEISQVRLEANDQCSLPACGWAQIVEFLVKRRSAAEVRRDGKQEATGDRSELFDRALDRSVD